MATYSEIQDYVKGKYHFTPKSCWIADVKERNGLPVRRAYNRISDTRTNPCPEDKVASIIDAFRHFRMIRS
jgi:hypothetical protein